MAKAKAAKAKKSPGKAAKPAKAPEKAKKLPKGLRKFAPLKTLMSSELGREILAEALVAAAAAAAAALTKKRPATKIASAISEATPKVVEAAKQTVQTAADAVAGVVTEAAHTYLPTAVMGEREPKPEGTKTAGKPAYAHLASDLNKVKKSPRKAPKPERPAKH
ncbi:hypothetical protein [Microvirga terricola]|uniref:Uncharacterized protein n=1 Tax=Microvirga terricola TaxID=2719797 RepID=A0ABX0VGA0_9HYPH|nr:hypothetical protein [Microvirga terricola]NIX78035.1 hypothetical protein [Microvirga terricola]